MVQLRQRFQSFEEYLSYNDGTNNLYELFKGKLIPRPPESGFTVEIATLLLLKFTPKSWSSESSDANDSSSFSYQDTLKPESIEERAFRCLLLENHPGISPYLPESPLSTRL